MTTEQPPYVEVLAHGAPREKWLAVRREGLGGSDCSGVMGMSKYASPYTVWEDKTGRAPEVDESEAMLWGNLLEPVIRAEAMRRLGLEFTVPGTLRSLERPWQQANLDGRASDGGVIEIKNTSAWMSADWDGQVPDHAELQCQHNMAVTGADHAWVAGLIGGCRLAVGCVDRDESLIGLINTEEERLWVDHIRTDTPPPLTASDATHAALLRRFQLEDRMIELNADDAADLAQVWVDGHRQVKSGLAAKKYAENEFRLLMQGANRATVDGHTVARITGGTWASNRFEDAEPATAALYRKKVDVVDSAALRASEPELWKRFQAQVFKAFPLIPTQEG